MFLGLDWPAAEHEGRSVNPLSPCPPNLIDSAEQLWTRSRMFRRHIEKARYKRALGCDDRLVNLGRCRKWLNMAELSEKGILIVVAVSRHDPPLFV